MTKMNTVFLRKMNNVKISMLGTVISVSLVATLAIFIGISILNLNTLNSIDTTWKSYENSAAKKVVEMSKLRDALGYGGMIHNFKNYILRQDQPRIAKIRAKIAESYAALEKLKALSSNSKERTAIAAIGTVVRNYADNVNLAERMANEGSSPQEVDAVIKISDTPALDALKDLDGIIATEQASTALILGNLVEENKSVQNMAIWIIGLILSAIVGLVVWFVRSKLIKPLTAMQNSMNQLAEGDTSVDIPYTDREDEIGEMATSVNVFKDNALERVRLEKEAEKVRIDQEEADKRRSVEKSFAEEKKLTEEKRLEREAEEKHLADRLEMAQKFEDRVGGVLETVASAATELNATSESMSNSANRMKQESVSAAAATTQAGQNVQLVASASEEMTVSVQEISSQITNATNASKNAIDSVNNASARVTQMADSSDKISEVIQLINDIAEQTNLLALNATIEAARAGDAGKGFAVVASEVKSLASQTATATHEIRVQISGMQKTTSDTVSAVQEISVTIGELDRISSSIAAAVEQQAVAMQEISRNSLEAASGTETAGENVKNVSQLAEETGDAASGVLNASNELSVQASSLNVAVYEFLTEIRTG